MRRASDHAIIETPRLVLKPVAECDVREVANAIGNYDVARWLGRVPYPYRVADAEAFIAANAQNDGRVWFIHDAGGLVGGISIDGELGYWLKRTAWDKGYATEAGIAAVEAHFSDPEAGELVSGHYLANDRSRRVLEKLGFRPAGQRIVAARALGQTVESRAYRLTRSAWEERRVHLSAVMNSDRRSPEGDRT